MSANTDSAIARLDSFASLFGVAEPISVIVPASIQQVARGSSARRKRPEPRVEA